MKPLLLAILTLLFGSDCYARIDRRAVVNRHRIVTYQTDTLSPAQVGNGHFAFGMDITGLQTFVPFNTLSDWGWHSFPKNEVERAQHYRGVAKQVGDRTIHLDYPDPQQREISKWLARNPHRLNLGRLGFRLLKADGSIATERDLHNISQETDLWSGVVTSRFTLEGQTVEVQTACHPERDAVGVAVKSELLRMGRLQLFALFPYGDGRYHAPYVGDYKADDKHSSKITKKSAHSAQITRRVDTVVYQAYLGWSDKVAIRRAANSPHHFELIPQCKDNSFSLVCEFSPQQTRPQTLAAEDIIKQSAEAWQQFWLSGAAVDLSGSEDPRWKELERRVVLSQYQMRMNAAGLWPPQESGLVNNTWYGRFHFEMIWWHETHHLLWSRPELAAKTLQVYRRFLPTSCQRARQQGYKGARWPKCTADRDVEWPHRIHATLVWQQPHPIYFAETLYRINPNSETLKQWGDIVDATAEYMADFVRYDKASGHYILGSPLCIVSENTPIAKTKNPTYELAYWRYGLEVAQRWRERVGLSRNKRWDEVLAHLAPVPVEEGVYVTYEGIPNMWTKYNFEHPALTGVYGMLPGLGVDKAIFEKTLSRVLSLWNFNRVWGWDFPMLAMAAARCNRPQDAVDLLLYDSKNFRFDAHGLATGGPFPYHPSNGGLLAAVAMMAGGWDGSQGATPGFPANWHVRAEGFQRMQ